MGPIGGGGGSLEACAGSAVTVYKPQPQSHKYALNRRLKRDQSTKRNEAHTMFHT